jgi:hypothetical protein
MRLTPVSASGLRNFLAASLKPLKPPSVTAFPVAQMMHLLAMRPRGEYCTDRVVHCCVTFVNSSIELSNTYKLLKPHLVSAATVS